MAERLLANDLNVNVTYEVYLSGGQRRLKEAVLYVANKSRPMTFFGRVKLNKIIWRADFRSFYGRRLPVTGRTYQKLEWGPALIEMVPVMQGLLREGILIQEARIHAGEKEFRPVALVEPILKFFSREDIEYLDELIHHYWDMSGTESSDESHGIAWKSRQIGDLIPYEASYFSDIPLSETALRKLSEIAAKHNLYSG